MGFLSRLFSPRNDPRDRLRPLWYRVVEISRSPDFYARCGVADTVDGRFDMITLVLATVLLRMESAAALQANTALLTELFVDDMDGQLRQSGVGDLMVGKRMGKLVSVLGGRLGMLRDALASGEAAALVAGLERNATFGASPDAAALASRLQALHEDLARASDTALMDGDFAR